VLNILLYDFIVTEPFSFKIVFLFTCVQENESIAAGM